MKDFFELASFIVTVIGLPCAIGIFIYEQRQERENEEEEQYQHLSDAYNEFLKVVLDHADLQLRTHEPLPLLLRGEDPAFQAYIKRVAQEERGPASILA